MYILQITMYKACMQNTGLRQMADFLANLKFAKNPNIKTAKICCPKYKCFTIVTFQVICKVIRWLHEAK